MKENIVVVYGSGASFASGYKVKIRKSKPDKDFGQAIDPPTDQNFFNKIKEINDNLLQEYYYALWKFKKFYFSSTHSVGLEEVWTAVDLNHKHITLDTYNWEKETDRYIVEDAMHHGTKYPNMDVDNSYSQGVFFDTSQKYNKYKFLGDCGRDLRHLIYDVYSNYEILTDQDCLKRLHESLKNSKGRIIGYITFNYDCYLENSLKDQNFKYIHANSNTELFEMLLEGGIPIIKLHGSLSWEEKREGILHKIIYHAPPYSKDFQVEPKYSRDSEWSQPAIIPPTIFKQEINDDSRTGNPITQTILQQWRAAITVLKDADRIIFVGYSFPPTDFHSKRVFQISSMIRRKNNDQPIKILYCTGPNDDDSEKMNLLKGIFGDDTDIRIVHGFDKLLTSNELQELLASG